jgi:hypothetical protein
MFDSEVEAVKTVVVLDALIVSLELFVLYLHTVL